MYLMRCDLIHEAGFRYDLLREGSSSSYNLIKGRYHGNSLEMSGGGGPSVPGSQHNLPAAGASSKAILGVLLLAATDG